MAAVPKAISVPTAAARSPRQPTAVVTAIAPIGDLRRSTERSRREPGSTPSRAAEYIVRAVGACAAMPQETKATSTIAANGLEDHDPNDATTAVVTGSTSSPATTEAGSGCASVAATALRITSAATLSRAIQIAR